MTTTEEYNWLKKRSHITNGLSDYLMRQRIHSTVEDVSKKEQIGYKKLTIAIEKEIATEVDWSSYTRLKIIGIDEFATKKGGSVENLKRNCKDPYPRRSYAASS